MMGFSVDYSSTTTNRQRDRISLFTDPELILTNTYLSRPSGPRYTWFTIPLSQKHLGVSNLHNTFTIMFLSGFTKS